MGLNLFSRPWRWAKILFFVASMVASLLLDCAPPLLVVLLDLFLPSALFAAARGDPPSSVPALGSHLLGHQFRASLVDLPLLSAARSLLLLCFYLCWSGKGPYLGATTVCSVASAGYVSLKAISMFGAAAAPWKRHLLSFGEKEGPAVEALFLSSLALAIAHVVAAYRTSCRERRKMLVYKIDVEAVYAYQNDFSSYNKIVFK